MKPSCLSAWLVTKVINPSGHRCYTIAVSASHIARFWKCHLTYQGDGKTCLEPNPDKGVIGYMVVVGMLMSVSVFIAMTRTMSLSIVRAVMSMSMPMPMMVVCVFMSIIVAMTVMVILFVFQDRNIPQRSVCTRMAVTRASWRMRSGIGSFAVAGMARMQRLCLSLLVQAVALAGAGDKSEAAAVLSTSSSNLSDRIGQTFRECRSVLEGVAVTEKGGLFVRYNDYM